MTISLRNISPLGQLDLPIIGRRGEPYGQTGAGCLEPGEVFDGPEELLDQSANFELATPEAPADPAPVDVAPDVLPEIVTATEEAAH